MARCPREPYVKLDTSSAVTSAVVDALERMLSDGGPRTPDLGGDATTADVTAALASSFA